MTRSRRILSKGKNNAQAVVFIIHRHQPSVLFTNYSRVINAVKYLLKNFTSPILCNILCKRLHNFLFVRVSAYRVMAVFTVSVFTKNSVSIGAE